MTVSKAMLVKAEQAAEILLGKRVYAMPVGAARCELLSTDPLLWGIHPDVFDQGDAQLGCVPIEHTGCSFHNGRPITVFDTNPEVGDPLRDKHTRDQWHYYPVLVHERRCWRWWWVIEEDYATR